MRGFDCPSAATGTARISAGKRNLSEQDIGNAPIASDFPGLNGIEMNSAGTWGLLPILYVHAKVLTQLRQRRLHFARFVRATRLDHRLLSVPRPVERKPGMRPRKHRSMKLRLLPTPSAVGGHVDPADRARTGPS